MRPHRFRAGLAAAFFAITVFSCAEDVNVVRLTTSDPPFGFTCTDPADDTPLAARALGPTATGVVSLVVDYLSLGGVPSCRPAGLLSWCADLGCPVVARDCVELDVAALSPADPIGSAAEIFAGTHITEDAPDGPVLVRMVGTTQHCSEVATGPPFRRYRLDQLVGCIYSCPVQLDEVKGEIELELDVFGSRSCDLTHVAACADVGL